MTISPYIFPGLNCSHLLTTENIIDVICKTVGVSVEQMKSKSRRKDHLMARYYYCYIQRMFIQTKTHKEIGKLFSGRDHSSIVNAINSFSNMLETDLAVRNNFMVLLKSLSYSWVVQFENSLPGERKPIKLGEIKALELAEDFGEQIFFKE